MTYGNRLKEVRTKLNLTQGEIADVLGFKWHKIKDIEAGKLKLTVDIANTIEEKYSIDGWWLLTGKGEMFTNEHNVPAIIPAQHSSEAVAIQGQQVSVRYYEDVYAAAGYGAINPENADVQEMVIDIAFIQSILGRRSVENLEIIKIAGDSMEPYIHDGETIMVERTKNANNNNVVIARIGEEIYVKRLIKQPFTDWVKLISDNAQYEDIVIDSKDKLEQFEILGVVRGRLRAF